MLLFVLAAVGLPYCMLHAVKAIHDEDKDGRELFTTLSCVCAGYLAVFAVLLICDIL